jgi:ERF superfamily.
MPDKLAEVNNLQIKTVIEDFKEAIARSFEEVKKVQAEQMESPTVKEISTALSIAQKDIRLPEKDKMGARAKYADLASCFDAIREIFGVNGLSFQQPLIYIDGEAYLYTIIRHSSGEWIKSKAKLIPYKVATTQEMQSFGGQLTYMRRYMLTSMLGLIGADEDRDAEDCDQRMEPREAYKKPTKRPMQVSTIRESNQGSTVKESNGVFINSEQASTILTLLTGRGDIKSRVLEELNIRSISGMLKKDYDLTLQRIAAQVQIAGKL